MPVSLTCTGCKTTLKVRDDLAGKKVKCPRCAATLVVPGPDEEIVVVEAIPDDRISKAPAKDKSRPRRDDPDEDEERKPRSRRNDPDEDEEEEERGRDRKEKHSAGIRTGRNRDRDQDDDEDERPRKKGKGRDRDEEDEDDRGRDRPVRKSKFKPCPRCEATGAKKVLWTAWGSFYGPSMFNHVRCPECSYCYNGKTGRSNLLPAIIFVTVPLLGILAIIGAMVYIVFLRGYIG